MPKRGKGIVVKEIEKDCGVTKTVIKENPFGKFQTLPKAIRDWVESNRDRRVLKSRFTTVKGKLKNEHHRAINIMHVAADVTDAEITDEVKVEVCEKCNEDPCVCVKVCDKCGQDPCECVPE